MTKAIYCDFNPRDIKLLEKYRSPPSEASTFKGIPMKLYNGVTWLLPNKNRRIKFRGKSRADIWYKRPQSFCHKYAAETFAIYYDNDYELHLGRP